ncbi:hypothetical protein DASB73_009990 [Starmerella bacillaris]|uniref:Uncharacterized protein n=1 Tax=Starmerella bacillaris TaxID=1247836 RepID=A0AAV5REN9_STABA|nr:hypothetical protein DASB73_009990 [Starmerella bacillaris]
MVLPSVMSPNSLFVSQVCIDHLEQIYLQTIGSIKGSSGLALWCWVNYSNMSTNIKDLSYICYASIAWFLLVTLTKALIWLNTFLVEREFGTWELNPETDRILITGGSQGLGLLLAANFAIDGYKVDVFDLHQPEFPIDNCFFHNVDVSDDVSVANAIDKLPGKQFLVINCAGIVGDSTGKLREIQRDSIRDVVNTNLLGSMYVTREMLAQKDVKMVVGISSSTALASPAEAGVYAASKAGIRTFYESLYYQNKTLGKRTRVLCITPGQLDTTMFEKVKTPSEFFSPIMRSAPLSKTICDAIAKGRTGEMLMPMYARWLPIMALLPRSIINMLRDYIGIDHAISSS